VKRNHRPRTAAVLLLAVLCGNAEAQWVFLARHAVGRIEQMSHTAPGGASSDVATVIVEVAPDRVYDTVKRRLAASREVTVSGTDDARRSVSFTDGRQAGGIQVVTLGDSLAQLMVSTTSSGAGGTTSATLVERILGVCKELKVACGRSQP